MIDERLATLYQQLTLAFKQLPAEQHRDIAQYYSLLGRVYESQQRFSDALTLTQLAIDQLQYVTADDLRVIYNWQAAKLYKTLHQQEAALVSYRRAITAIQNIRQDIPVTYHHGQSSFFQLFGPLYRDAVALLLQQASAGNTKIKTPLLQEARELMERLKQTELEDFFKDRCLLSELENPARWSQNGKLAVFYPIILADRVELLIGIGDHLYQYTVAVDSATLEKHIRSYASHLRRGQEDRDRKLYDWLIKPWEAQLKAQGIDTIGYVPDGPLRLLPLASLYDGQHYLLERYAVVTTPGLGLLSSTATTVNKTLMVGLSEPGSATVTQLPDKLLTQIMREAVVERGSGLADQPQLRGCKNFRVNRR